MARTKAMPSDREQVANDIVDREEPLGLCCGCEAPHLGLASARRLVGDFSPVVSVAGGVVIDGRHENPMRGAVAPEAIRDETVRDTPLRLSNLRRTARRRGNPGGSGAGCR
jgi:hypothetical protein